MTEAGEQPVELDDFERQFVDEYLVDKKKGPAALRAGATFKEHRQRGFHTYERPHVQEAIRKALEEQSVRTGVEADKTLREVAYIAFSDIREIRLNDDGSISCTTATGRAIQSIEIDRTTRTMEDGTVEVNIKGKVKLYDKRLALTTIMQHLGLLITELPALEVLLNRLPPNVSAVLRTLIANPNKMPVATPAVADVPILQTETADDPNIQNPGQT